MRKLRLAVDNLFPAMGIEIILRLQRRNETRPGYPATPADMKLPHTPDGTWLATKRSASLLPADG